MTASTTADPLVERLAHFGPLDAGVHHSYEHRACVMEAVSYVAGEAWSDHPDCACPVISAFLRVWNDWLPDDERDALLRPLIPFLIGTKGSEALEEQRAIMAVDWLIRAQTPALLRLVGLDQQAEDLASLPKITTAKQMPSISGLIAAARGTAGNAAGDAVWVAAGNADVVATWAADVAAAGDALLGTRKELRQSALALVYRMISAKE